MFDFLEGLRIKPKPFEVYTARELWTNEHTSKKMLEYHLNEAVDMSSRRGEFVERSAKWISDKFTLGQGKEVADFGCGPGLYAARFAGAGASVTAIDFSRRSIEYAREFAENHSLSIDYHCQDYLQFSSDRQFDLITLIYCDLCALSPEQRKTLLCKFAGLLKAGGAVLLDVTSLQAFDNKEESASYEYMQLNSFWSDEPYFGFLNVFKYDQEKLSLDKYTIVKRDKVRRVYNWLQYFSVESLAEEMKECGLRIDEGYGDVAGSPFDPELPQFAVVARRIESK